MTIHTNLQPLHLDDFILYCALRNQCKLYQCHPRMVQRKNIQQQSPLSWPLQLASWQRKVLFHRVINLLQNGPLCIPLLEPCKSKYTLNSNTIQANVSSSPKTDQLLDSRASSHIFNDVNQLSTLQSYNVVKKITIGNCHSIPINNEGLLPTPSHMLLLKQIFHSPNLLHNLLSVHKLTCDNNYFILFGANGFVLKDTKTNQIITHDSNTNESI